MRGSRLGRKRAGAAEADESAADIWSFGCLIAFAGTGEAPYLELLPLIRALIAAFGCERLMWATDSPYQS